MAQALEDSSKGAEATRAASPSLPSENGRPPSFDPRRRPNRLVRGVDPSLRGLYRGPRSGIVPSEVEPASTTEAPTKSAPGAPSPQALMRFPFGRGGCHGPRGYGAYGYAPHRHHGRGRFGWHGYNQDGYMHHGRGWRNVHNTGRRGAYEPPRHADAACAERVLSVHPSACKHGPWTPGGPRQSAGADFAWRWAEQSSTW